LPRHQRELAARQPRTREALAKARAPRGLADRLHRERREPALAQQAARMALGIGLDDAVLLASAGIQRAVLEARHELLAAYAEYFLEAGLARLHPAHAVLAQALHALRARVVAQVGLGGAVVDQAARLVVDQQQLEDAAAPLVAGERAGLAARRGEQGVRPAAVAVREQRALRGVGLVAAAARRAQAPHQARRAQADAR